MKSCKKKELRVAFVGPFPLDASKVTGGVQAVVKNLVMGLQALPDLDLHVVTVDFDRDVSAVPIDGVEVHHLPSSKGFSQFLFYARERRWIRRTLEKIQPDVVHVHGTDMYGYASLRWRFPTLLTVHGILNQEAKLDYADVRLPHRALRKVKGLFNSYFETRTLRHVRHVVAISPYVTSVLNGFQPENLYFIDNPVDEVFFNLRNRAAPNRILFVGLIRARKAILHLLKAVNLARDENPDLRLNIVGKVLEPEYGRMLREYVEANRLHLNVHFRGRVDDQELFREFEECQMLVLPSAEETSPMVVEQAMAAGKPVVATTVGGIPFLVEEGKSGILVEYGDIQGLAEAILFVLRDAEAANAMGKRAKEIAEERFKTSVIAAKTKSVYEAVFFSAEPQGARN